MMWFTGDPREVRAEPGREIGWNVENLRKPGFEPATVIDVGAAFGTAPLYRSFPDAFHVMIEPLREYAEDIERWLTEFRGVHLPLAVGEREDTVTLHVDPELLFWSSLLPYSKGRQGRTLEERTIPLTTIDKLLDEHGWDPPFGLKIDTEGYEHHVIAGGKKLLEQTQFVIAEVSVSRRFEQSYTFAEFIALMDRHGFQLHDVLDGMKSWHGRVFFVDAVFTPKQQA
jgi:FkbM family methyltransferase